MLSVRQAWLGLVVALLFVRPALADEKLRFVIDWKPDAERGGYYQALAKGFYKARGLDVTIVPGGPGVDNARLIAAGAVDLAQVANCFAPLNLVAAGAAVKAVMATYQRSPQVLIAHPEAGFKSLADMVGHPMMISDGAVATFWVWLKSRYGFDDRQIRRSGFDLAPWIVDPTAVIQGYATSDPYVLAQQHVPAQFFLLADSGYPGYGAVVLASDALIQAKPAVVQAFVDASIAGWRDYLDGDPTPGLALVKNLNDEATDARNEQVIRNIKAYQLVEGGDAATLGIGIMTEQRWQDFFRQMTELRIYPADLDWHAAFTLRFVGSAGR